VLGFAGGTAFAGQPLVALGVSLGLATLVGVAADVARRLRRPATSPAPVPRTGLPPAHVPAYAGGRTVRGRTPAGAAAGGSAVRTP
jgi:hypothetical protein